MPPTLRRSGITTTTLGLGHNFDEQLLSAMAEAGGGNFTYIESASQLARTFERELDRLTAITATRLNLRIRFPDGLHGTLLNPFPVERTGKQFDVAIDDLSSGDEVVLVFDITGRNLLRRGSPELRALDAVDRSGISASGGPPRRRSARSGGRRSRPCASMPRSDEVATHAAMLRAAANQRRAMELDRSGRFSESRTLLRQAYDGLMNAPDTEEVLHLRDEAMTYAAHDAAAPLTEHTRKQAVQNSVSRSRRRQPADRQP